MSKNNVCEQTRATYYLQHVVIGAALSDKAWWDGLSLTKMAVSYRWGGCDMPVNLYIGRLHAALTRAK